MQLESTYDADTTKKLEQIGEWIEQSKSQSGLVDIQFCPRDLRDGPVQDYIADAYAMLNDYRRHRYNDVTDIIL